LIIISIKIILKTPNYTTKPKVETLKTQISQCHNYTFALESRTLKIMTQFILGFILWSFIEYCFHRWVLHRRNHTHIVHDKKHHQNVKYRPSQNFFLFTGIKLLVTSLYFMSIFGLGFSIGILWYVLMHHLSHTRHLPNCILYYHQYHHLVDDKTCFGISSPIWDYILGTSYKKKVEFTYKQKAFFFGK
jgi:hypothetical protein